MKIPKQPILVGTLLLGATMGLTGCVNKDEPVYTAYGVPSPEVQVGSVADGGVVENPVDNVDNLDESNAENT